jgi:hypothetical protein
VEAMGPRWLIGGGLRRVEYNLFFKSIFVLVVLYKRVDIFV